MEKKTKVARWTKKDDDVSEGDKVMIGGRRVTEEEYKAARTFVFLHHFAGGKDGLKVALEKEAEKRNMKVKVFSIEKKNGSDLLATQPYQSNLKDLKEGNVDGYHSGFPCATYSRLRWNDREGYPGPLRSKTEPYGFRSLSAKEKKEADDGTIMMVRSIEACRALEINEAEFRIPAFYTMENPPPSNAGNGQHISAWEMPEMEDFMASAPSFQRVLFHTCRYQSDVAQGMRFKKPQMFGGSLPGLARLGRFCNCTGGHLEVVGHERSQASGEYPKELCEVYAEIAFDYFEKMAKAEFLDAKAAVVRKKIDVMKDRTKKLREDIGKMAPPSPMTPPTRTAPSSPRKRRVEPEEEEAEEPASSSYAWVGGQGKYGAVRESRAKSALPKNVAFVGGMRHPQKAVEQLPTVQALGLKVNGAWERFVKENPKVLETAETYGTKEVTVHQHLVEKWRAELKKLLGARPEKTVKLVEKDVYQTPVDTKLFSAWQSRSGDPDDEVPKWLEGGCPLGIEREIVCRGIFPPMDEEEDKKGEENFITEADLERKGFRNYLSMEENFQDADIEIERYVKEGYVTRMPKEMGMERYKGGTVSRLGLIVKEKEGGEKKRRVVIDLRRSGGNGKSRLPEKLVLPRPQDVIQMLKEMNQRGEGQAISKHAAEFVVIDIADAFTTLPLHVDEHKHAVSPSNRPNEILVFKALLFGYKTAPLLYSRFGAFLARLLQACVDPAVGRHQVYLDDSLWALMGGLEIRNKTLALVLYNLLALKVKVAMHKGERAAHVTWVGVRFSFPEKDVLVLGLPMKFLQETKVLLESWDSKGMAPLKELRTLAGKAAWLANVLPRARWVTSVMYAVLKACEREDLEREGKEGKRDKSF